MPLNELVIRIRWLAVVVVCILCESSTARAGVEVVGSGHCIEVQAVRTRLEAVAQRAEKLGQIDVQVAERFAPDGAARVELHVTHGARVLVDRLFELAPTECTSAAALLALVVDRLVTELPVESWDDDAAVTRRDANHVEVAALPAHRELSLVSAATVTATPLGGDLELGARVDQGRAWRIGGGLLVRQTLPSVLGRGTVASTSTMATAGAHYVGHHWSAGVELRGGGLRLSGRGFADNRTAWVPWAEAAMSLAWVGRYGSIGVVVSGSSLSYHALTADLMEATEIPRFRVGVGVSVPIWQNP